MNARIYWWMLALYPEELRREFGEEMVLVFADELRDADLAGRIRVWWRALREFISIALPSCASRPAMRVPAIAAAFAIASLGGELLLHYAAETPLRFVIFVLPSWSLFLVPSAALYICRGRSLTALNINEER